MEPKIDAAAAGAAHATDMSFLGLFLQADIVVQAVMLALIACSIWCWAIIIDKALTMRKLRNQAKRFENTFWSGGSLDELHEKIGKKPGHPMARLFSNSMKEWKRSARGRSGIQAAISLQGRLDAVADITINREMEKLEKGLGFLATIGSTAPFVGLFGTVWGIMNSFSSIAVSKNTSLVVVAPGIAEALLATALGLVAAIPAVMAYNKISNDLGKYAGKLDGFAGELSAMLTRQVEEREIL